MDIDRKALIIAGALFTASIAVNFFSQLFGIKANSRDTDYCKAELNKARGKEVQTEQMASDKCWAGIYSTLVEICNWVSIGTMTIAIILIAFYTAIFSQ